MLILKPKFASSFARSLQVAPEKVKLEASFVDDLKADSLAVVELVLALEEKFEIEIPDEDTERIKTVKDAVDYIKEHRKKSVVALPLCMQGSFMACSATASNGAAGYGRADNLLEAVFRAKESLARLSHPQRVLSRC